jgi:hypothetical protein
VPSGSSSNTSLPWWDPPSARVGSTAVACCTNHPLTLLMWFGSLMRRIGLMQLQQYESIGDMFVRTEGWEDSLEVSATMSVLHRWLRWTMTLTHARLVARSC